MEEHCSFNGDYFLWCVSIVDCSYILAVEHWFIDQKFINQILFVGLEYMLYAEFYWLEKLHRFSSRKHMATDQIFFPFRINLKSKNSFPNPQKVFKILSQTDFICFYHWRHLLPVFWTSQWTFSFCLYSIDIFHFGASQFELLEKSYKHLHISEPLISEGTNRFIHRNLQLFFYIFSFHVSFLH